MKKKYINNFSILIILLILFLGILIPEGIHKHDLNKKKESFGFIDKKGNFIIGPLFCYFKDFKEGLAFGFDGNKRFYINKTGDIEFENDGLISTTGFSDGLTQFREGSKYLGYINKKGKVIIKPTFYMASNFSEGLAAVYIYNKGWGFINKKGETVIQPKNYFIVYGFSEGLCAVKTKEEWVYKKDWVHQGVRYKEFPLKTQKWGFINKKGEIFIKDKFDSVRDFSEGLAVINLGGWISTDGFEEFVGGKYGFINKKGEIVIKPKYDWAGSFSEGLASIFVKNKGWGFINKKGSISISCRFDDVKFFKEGMSAVKLDGKWGFIDKKANIIIKTEFDLVKTFSEGFTAVKQNGKWGYIDKKGNWIVKPQFIDAYPFSEGLARVKVEIESVVHKN